MREFKERESEYVERARRLGITELQIASDEPRSIRQIGLIEKYLDRMPFEVGDTIVSLNEGATPLIYAPRLSLRVNADVYLKYEGLNPTGSFKDRGMCAAVSAAVREGARAVICASTGNTAASLAAYAARAGIRGVVLVPDGKIAAGKLAQALMHGAEVIALEGNFDEALRLVREIAQKHPISLVNSVNDFRIEGQKTAAFEVVEDLGRAPDALCIPVGNAGNITAYWKGFREFNDPTPAGVTSGLGGGTGLPMMFGFQAEGANPLVRGEIVDDPETIASAIRIGSPARWEEAMAAMKDSGGNVADVSDEEILEAYRFLAREEGVFCEPASATSVAGLIKHGAGDAQTIVCVLTGHGLKDPQTAIEQSSSVVPCKPTMEALEKILLS